MNSFRNWKIRRWRKRGKQKRAQIPQNPEFYLGGTSSSHSTSSSTSNVAPHIACVSNIVEPTKTPINYLAQTPSYTSPSYPTTFFFFLKGNIQLLIFHHFHPRNKQHVTLLANLNNNHTIL